MSSHLRTENSLVQALKRVFVRALRHDLTPDAFDGSDLISGPPIHEQHNETEKGRSAEVL
jgi:hypothetical protein